MKDHPSPKTLRWNLSRPQARDMIQLLRWYVLLALLEGLAALIQLVSLPGKIGSQGIPGLSPLRLAIAAPILSLLVVLLWFLIALWRQPARFEKLVDRLSELAGQRRIYWGTLVLSSAVFVFSLYLILLNWINTDIYLKAYLDRLAPYALWGMFLCVQTAVILRLLRFGTDVQIFKSERKALTASVIAFAIFLSLALWINWTRIGLVPDGGQWGGHSTPILSMQVMLGLAISAAFWLLGRHVLTMLKNSHRPRFLSLPGHTIDILFCILVWGIAVWRWGTEPLRPSYFSPAPVPPNYEYYPYSDAANYDFAAQSLLIGYGLENPLVRPLYSSFLAVAQASNGIGYQNALEWQIPLLAIIPALLYLITKTVHSRLAGFFVGLLAIIHESNSIALAGLISVSHAKLLMSDLPTQLGVIAFAALVVLWLRDPGSRRIFPFLVGGVLALTMLIRVQVVILLPVVIIVLAARSRKPKQFSLDVFLLSVGLLSAIIPWMGRNWLVRGRFSLSEAAQTSQIGLIGQFYSATEKEELRMRLPGETDDQYVSRMLGNARQFVQEHPLEAVRFITAHTVNNEITTFSVLPSSFPLLDFFRRVAVGAVAGPSPEWSAHWRRCCSVRGYINNLDEWKNEGSQSGVLSITPVLFGLMAVAIGIGKVWGRDYLAAIFLLSANFVYSLGNALVRTSGWRFNLPVEWVGYIFYGIGLSQLCLWGVAFFRNHLVYPVDDQEIIPFNSELKGARFPLKQVILGSLALFLLVAAIPIAEFAIPKRYGNVHVQAILMNLDEQDLLIPLGITSQTLNAFVAEDRAEVVVGRALYPRYFTAGDGEPGNRWPSFTARPFNRLGFFLIGPLQRHVVLRTPEAPKSFPHAVDVLVLGCTAEDYLDAYLVVLLDPLQVILERTPLASWNCPG